ncbi:hypothetical protein BG28_01865 [Nesterenkonia sp. AN1]|nr:hypothetical protein BG28_01865 [Nesterenkonia sp. AN1]
MGLGESQHRSDLPEAEHDFISSILGEELGLLGAAVAAWIAGQASLNIGMVTGLLPVAGVPLPFISAGGSALTCGLLGVGGILNFARGQLMSRHAGTPPHALRGGLCE